jgi:hypothetical protein
MLRVCQGCTRTIIHVQPNDRLTLDNKNDQQSLPSREPPINTPTPSLSDSTFSSCLVPDQCV